VKRVRGRARRVAAVLERRGSRRFPCAVCGDALERTPRRGGRGRRALEIVCGRCRFRIYDYPRVCVGFVVVKRDHLLLLTRGHQPKRGRLDLPGGFLEAGEDLEAAARRELFEETRLRVGPAAPFGAYWDRYDLPGFGEFPTLNYYYLARWRSGVPRAGDDAADAHWVRFAEAGRAALQRRFAWPHMRRVVRELRRRLAPRTPRR
jgi:ADP-ribose pyrophosphatase YjhB (NUDIX family)